MRQVPNVRDKGRRDDISIFELGAKITGLTILKTHTKH